jgi:hypothetical protein
VGSSPGVGSTVRTGLCPDWPRLTPMWLSRRVTGEINLQWAAATRANLQRTEEGNRRRNLKKKFKRSNTARLTPHQTQSINPAATCPRCLCYIICISVSIQKEILMKEKKIRKWKVKGTVSPNYKSLELISIKSP